MSTTIYSEQRARLITMTLRCVQGLALAMIGLAVFAVIRTFGTPGDPARQSVLLFFLLLLIQAGVLLRVVFWALRRLPGRGADARTWSLATGVLVLVSSLPLITNLLGIVAVFLGLLLLSLALPRDRER